MNTHDTELPEPKYPGTKADIPNAIPDLYTADQVRSAIEADRNRRGEPVGDGWKLVPVEPTPEMLAAFQQGFKNELHKNDRRRTMSAEEAGLRAMLKAVPQTAQPVQEKKE